MRVARDMAYCLVRQIDEQNKAVGIQSVCLHKAGQKKISIPYRGKIFFNGFFNLHAHSEKSQPEHNGKEYQYQYSKQNHIIYDNLSP
jgi:cytosine/adenosine deaminase-related metal-dependent hydrolase